MLGRRMGTKPNRGHMGCPARAGPLSLTTVINAEERARMLGILQLSAMDSRLPNPSVLLALNLARDSSKAQQDLGTVGLGPSPCLPWPLSVPTDMSSGQVALYTLALLSSCCDLRHVEAHGQSVDLLSILREKMDKEVAHWGHPAEHTVQCGAGCTSARCHHPDQAAAEFPGQALYEQAMMALPLVCAYNRNELQDMQDLLSTTLSNVTNKFLENQDKGNGLIGNIYSTGLAMQLLLAAGKFYAPRKWDCTQPVAAITKHHLQQPMAIAQALPALMGRTYLDSASLDCSPEEPTATSLEVQQNHLWVSSGGCNRVSVITWAPTHCSSDPSPTTHLPHSFKTESTFWGPMVVSIHGLAANETERTYWQFFSGSDALQEGGQCWGAGRGCSGEPQPHACSPLQGLAHTSRTTGSTSGLSSAPTDSTGGETALLGPTTWQ
uniref:Cobalamin binding intrinsic factor n=1 Tax=Meleagris gallopavo TaxID=9103 RepID=A0A803XLW9_MELGA